MSKRAAAVRNNFTDLFRQLSQSYSMYENWQDFIILSACAISNSVVKNQFEKREKMYMDRAAKHSKKDMELFAGMLATVVEELETNPDQDFLGSMYMRLELGNAQTGQFFTPYDVSKMMAKMQFGDSFSDNLKQHIENGKGEITVHDCCVGGGAMLIGAINAASEALKDSPYNWQNYLLVCGQDIDMSTALMAYIQISLLGAAGYIKIGNSLTDPMHDGDDKESYWYTPMYCSNVWAMRRIWRSVCCCSPSAPAPAIDEPQEEAEKTEATESEFMQLTFDSF